MEEQDEQTVRCLGRPWEEFSFLLVAASQTERSYDFSPWKSPQYSFCYKDRTLLSLCDSLYPLPQIALSLAIFLTLLFINLKTDRSTSFSIFLSTLSSLRGVHVCLHMWIHFNKIAILVFGNLSSTPQIGTYMEPVCVHTLLFVLFRIWQFHFST